MSKWHRVPTITRVGADARAYYAVAEWRYCTVMRWGGSRWRACLNATRGVVFFALLQPFSRRWAAQERDRYPRWYDWMVG